MKGNIRRKTIKKTDRKNTLFDKISGTSFHRASTLISLTKRKVSGVISKIRNYITIIPTFKSFVFVIISTFVQITSEICRQSPVDQRDCTWPIWLIPLCILPWKEM